MRMRNETLMLRDIINKASDDMRDTYESESYVHRVLCTVADELRENGDKELADKIISCVCLIIGSYSRLDESIKLLDDWKIRDDQRLTDIESFRRSMVKVIYDSTSAKSNKLDDIASLMREFNSRLESLTEYNERLSEVIEFVETYEKTFALYKNMKRADSRMGENNPRYRVDIPMNEVIDRYNNGETVKELSKAYGMTEAGLMHRLKQAGVYKRKYNKYAK